MTRPGEDGHHRHRRLPLHSPPRPRVDPHTPPRPPHQPDCGQRWTIGPEYLYTHRWEQGDLVVWDNRAVLHTASLCDSSRHPRLLVRAAVHQRAPRPHTSEGGISTAPPSPA
ncbi:TauD/TfdA family dioxygenase [Streptomyces sp. NPDC001606]